MNAFDFTQSRREPRSESVVPMINVVFLLLIFFLMSAQIAPPALLELAPAFSDSAEETDPNDRVLWYDSDGSLAYGTARGDAVWSALANASGPLTLQADAATPAQDVARLLTRLRAAGIHSITLVTRPEAK